MQAVNYSFRNMPPEARGHLIAGLMIGAATALFVVGRAHFPKGQWALLYLLLIVIVARLSGIKASFFASVLAFLAWNYFLIPPYHTFAVDDPKDWLLLIVFLIVGAAIGLQTGRLKESESQARARERETSLLNQFSANLVAEISVRQMGQVLVSEVRKSTESECVALFVADETGELTPVSLSAAEGFTADEAALDICRRSYEQAKAIGLHGGNRMVFPLQTPLASTGVLYVGERRDGTYHGIDAARLVVALANLAAAFLERKRLQALTVQANALKEADKLKSVFLSSVSHDLKTPLSSAMAAVTNFLESDFVWDKAKVKVDIAAVKEDLDKLSASIGALIDLSRLESAAWEPKKDSFEIGEILGTTLEKLPPDHRFRINCEQPDDLPFLYVDFVQISRALGNVIENALIYSGPQAPVRVAFAVSEGSVRILIEDSGPGIEPSERGKVFEKFYRGSAAGRAPSGTGLGLAVAAEIVKFNGGRMWIEDNLPHGARVVISLPGASKVRVG